MPLKNTGAVAKIVILWVLVDFIVPTIYASFSDEISRFYSSSSNECFRRISNVSADGLLQELREISPCNYNLTIYLEDIDLAAFPNHTFSMVNTRIFILVLERTNFPLLAPSVPDYLPFNNVRFKRSVISIEDSGSLEGWRWEFLKDLTGEVKFYALRSELVYLRPEFGMIAGGKVIHIKIEGCGLKWLGENVFAKFSELKYLYLRGNSLQSIERSHLPTYGRELLELDLGHNSLTHLPQNLCDGLDLKIARFDGNKLAVYGNDLSKTSCSQVIKIDQVLDYESRMQNSTVHGNNSTRSSVIS